MSKFVLSFSDLQAIKSEMEEHVSDDPYNNPEEAFIPAAFANARTAKAKNIETDYAKLITAYNTYNSSCSDSNLSELESVLSTLSLRYLSRTCMNICRNNF